MKSVETLKQAVLLCAGFGIRLRPLTDRMPKQMLPIGGKPLLEHIISHLKKYDIQEFLINLHHLPEATTDYFGDGSKFGVKIIYSYESEILGTAGGLKKMEPYLAGNFLLIYGDVFNTINFNRFAEHFLQKQPCPGIQAVKKSDHPWDADLVAIDEEMRFQKIYPKPHKQLPTSSYYQMEAIYLLNKEILDFIPNSQYYELDHQLLPKLLEKGKTIFGYLLSEKEMTLDIGTPERYKELKNRIHSS